MGPNSRLKHPGILAAVIAPLALAPLAPTAVPAVQEPGKDVKSVERPSGPAQLGKPAPAFELKGLDGKTVRLADYKNKLVVLEWLNPTCPYCKHAHGERGPLRSYPDELRGKGDIWLAIVSEKPENPGGNVETLRKFVDEHGIKSPVLLDVDGKIGGLYGAKTTPHVFVISERGVLVYRGAIDNAPLGQVETNEGRINYVAAAIADLSSGHTVIKSETKPYGCAIQFARR